MSHEFDGEKYRKASAHQKEWGTKIISEFKLNGKESILDLGCGDGTLTSLLSELVPDGNVLGIDASEGMIKTAKELENQKLTFKKMDIDVIDFNEEFDLIFSNATLHWVKDHTKLLANCYKALKKNGAIRFNFAGEGNGSNFNEIIKQTISLEKYKKYFINLEWPWFMPSIIQYKTLVTNCDFENIQIWDENADRYFANENELIKWIDQPALVPFLKLVADEDKNDFRNEVISKMIERTKQSDGRCFETFRRINVKATKESL
ncbi:MAG: methyltransferase type 11 [Spirochaetes bacterium GWF1_31_7]|nr:MAG: methyltransferase type 11 [Spirochaetes bacterium GWE1_32_154]OHD47097.1 MAG: methyltransferase type 11 [Spirochaetes bacterium GWE2_31_10]OHD51740.1 MAG: methyltransferase type 11 [Spirochaetes bacterium GWF1_31_7]